MRYVYPCVLHAEEGGGYWVSFPDVKGASTGGFAREEALEMAEDALVAALGAYYNLGEDIPLPSPVGEGQEPVPLQPIAAAKVALNVAMRDQGVTKVALAKRLGVSEAAVRKLCNPDHRSHISTVERALHALGRGLIIEDAPWPSASSVPTSTAHGSERAA